MMHLRGLPSIPVWILAVFAAAAILAGCASPAPPKPAMVPLGQIGDFGYSERDLGNDRIEVTYTGAAVRVPVGASRNDAKVQAELAKTHDLALWRAAEIADLRGMAAIKIDKESRDTDVPGGRSSPNRRPLANIPASE